MKQNLYKLAVVIPCWNVEKYLPTMLDSLLNQTFTDWVAYCVDDQSIDKTANIIKLYQIKNNRIQYICRNRLPKGAQTCRNIGLSLASGSEFIVFFDADDILCPTCLEHRVKFLENHPKLDYGVFPAKTFCKDINEIPKFVYGVRFASNDLEAMLNMNLPMVGWTNIYRFSSLIKNGLLWDEKITSMQDSDFNINALSMPLKYDYANVDYDYYYRISNPNSLSGKIMNKNHADSHLYLLDKVLNNVSAKKCVNNLFLRIYVLKIMGKLNYEYQACSRILRLHWVKRNPVFWVRLLLFVSLGCRGRKYIFKSETLISQERTAEWANFVKTYIENHRA